MANIDADEVRHLAALASLALNDDEIDSLVSELKDIFKMIEEINAFDTDGVAPSAQITGLNHVVRSDEIKDYGVTTQQLLDATSSQDNQIKVPRVQ